MHKDLYHFVEPVVSIDTAVYSGALTATGAIIDTDGFESGQIVLNAKITDGEVAITSITESDDAAMAGATAIPEARIIGTLGALNATGVTDFGFIATKRYVQCNVAVTGVTVDMTANSICNLGHPTSTRG